MILAVSASMAGADTMDKTIVRTQLRSEPTPERQYGEKELVTTTEDVFLFNAKEWSLDVFGMYAFEADKGAYDDGFGGGIGVNYFFNRYFGMGLEGYGWNGDGVIGSASGNLMLRYPIEKWHLAPYLIGGIGGNFCADKSDDQVNVSGGIGVEYRFNAHWGIFTDARYVATDKTNDYGVARLGVRFSF